MEREIYLDNSATTRMTDAALEKYISVSRDFYGNPSSLHTLGAKAEKQLETARSRILSTLGARGDTLVFTSCGSEANNLAIFGRAFSKERFRGGRIITSAGEHASVSEPVKRLGQSGFSAVSISTFGGKLDLRELDEALTKDTFLVTIMTVNNETGAIYDIKSASALIRKKCPDALIHTDATQAYMKIPLSLKELGVDLMTVSSHKIGGPKGAGALIISAGTIKSRGLSPLIYGGGQESSLRSGTQDVAAMCAFGEAANDHALHFRENTEKMSRLRSMLIDRLLCDPALSEISATIPPSPAPHIVNITLPGIKSETMLHFLSSKNIYVSSGSACSSNSHGHSASPALIAFGRTPAEADCSLRISFSQENTEEDVTLLCEALAEGLSSLARISGGRRR